MKTNHFLLLVPAVALTLFSCACTGEKKETPDVPEEPAAEPLDPSLIPETVEIPAGTFTMGTAGAGGADYDEAPVRSVTLSAFRMGRCEVTNLQFEAFRPEHSELRGKLSERGFWFSSKDDEPVINVTWNDAVAYCEWLSAQTGRTFRLPTSAEPGPTAPPRSRESGAARGTCSCV